MATSPLIGPTEMNMMLLRLQDRLNVLEQTAILPAGIIAWCATDVPDGWLVCDGSTISQTRYGQLCARMGGTTLPNLQGRVVVGQDAATFATMLGTGGAETVTLTAAQSGSPAHSHPGGGQTGTESATHAHDPNAGTDFVTVSGVGSSGFAAGALGIITATATATENATHTHTDPNTGTSSAVAASASHSNLQPYVVLLPIIKF